MSTYENLAKAIEVINEAVRPMGGHVASVVTMLVSDRQSPEMSLTFGFLEEDLKRYIAESFQPSADKDHK